MSAPDAKRSPLMQTPLTLALPFQYQFAAGAIAGVTEILIMYPLDVVKTRFQLQVTGVGEQYTSMLDCVQKIIKKEG
jgi:solute carrier family 25 2-oxodicarboxylate transporter 21